VRERHSCRDRGAVTAELALTLPAIGLVLAIVLGGIGLTIDRGRLAQAAADGQRVHSYGGSSVDVTDYVHRVLGSADASVAISAGPGEHVSCVTVTRPGGTRVLCDSHQARGFLG